MSRRRDKPLLLMSHVSRLLVLALLVAGSLVFLTPFYISVAMSLKSAAELAQTSVWSWPKSVTLENYREVLANPNVSFLLFLQNTVVIAGFSTLGVVLSSSMVAYAFARVQFRGRDRLFILLLSTMMLPGIVTMIPTYVLYKYLHWVNTFYPLTVPAFLGGGAFNVFLLRQFFLSVPVELDEAAKLDGASHWTILTRVIMPLSGPALATVGVFTFIGSWRDFMGPLIYLNDVNKQTLELGLSTYASLRAEQWHLLMAGSVLVTIPLIIIFLIGQRYFVKGIVMSGMK
ncbi:MAG: carbohydrate ABC transporter permease [Fimbriimonadia bacterium]|jgi:ABC-type glycerol-3-phosphate transport system permease component